MSVLPEKIKGPMSVVRSLSFEAAIENFGATKDHTSYCKEGGARADEHKERSPLTCVYVLPAPGTLRLPDRWTGT
jgi:hypothetical protein